MTELCAVITSRAPARGIVDPENAPLLGFTAEVSYGNSVALISLTLDPPLPGDGDQQEGFAQALKTLGEVSAKPKTIIC